MVTGILSRGNLASGVCSLLFSLLILAQASTADFKTKLEQHRKLDADTGVGTLVIMDLARVSSEVCWPGDWPTNVEEFTAKNGLTEEEATLLGYYCIVYGRGVITGANEIVKTVKE